jgi:predicted HTH transcriptional regulator
MDAIVLNTDLSRRTVARAIKTLTEKQVIARIGSKKTGCWKIERFG